MKILIINWRSISDPLKGGAEVVTFEHAKRWASNFTLINTSFKEKLGLVNLEQSSIDYANKFRWEEKSKEFYKLIENRVKKK